MTIGEDRAAEVFKHLSQREVQTLSAAMANVTQISNKQLTDVLAEFEQEAEQFAALNINANDYLRSVLVKALGEERAASLLEDILETRDTASGIETLNFMEPQSAADLIRDEHPQIIATSLVNLKRAQAADILALFDERLRHDVMLRIATFGGVQPAALAELTEVLNGLLDGQNLKRSKMGGVRTAAEIINLMKTQQEEAVITAVREFDGELAALAAARVPRGTLTVNYTPSKHNDDPKYYSHFTVAKLKGGRYSTIELSNPDADMGAAGSLSAIFARPVELEEGDYMLVSGTRMANGTVLSEVKFFTVEAGKQTTLDMTMREDDDAVQVIGTMNPEAKFVPQGASEPQSILATTGRGYFVLALLEAKKEPTNHALRDIAALKSELEQWNRGLVFLFGSEEQLAAFNASEFGELPKTITYGVDKSGEVSAMLGQSLELNNMNDLPVFVVADTFGRVVFVSQGYRIGMGEQMMKVIRSL